jgi:flagellin-like protein
MIFLQAFHYRVVDMKHLKQQKTFIVNREAASPVIGVMLMVVITVILAAAVSSYGSGVISGTQTAPSAAFEVQIKKNIDVSGTIISFMKIKQVTGESIDTKHLKIVTFNANSSDAPMKEVIPNVVNTNISASGASANGVSPYWNNPAIGTFGDEAVDFGNFVLKPGVVMIAESNENDVGKSIGTGMEAMISDWANVTKGDFISVSIVHTRSGKVIFQSDVEVV